MASVRRCSQVAGRGRRHHQVSRRGHFASWNGTAPIEHPRRPGPAPAIARREPSDQSSLHIMATVQLRNPTEAGRYYDRPRRRQDLDGSDARPEATAVRHRLSHHARRRRRTLAQRSEDGPGGQRGNDSDSSAAGSHPQTSSSDKSLPGPARPQPRTLLQPRLDTEGSHESAVCLQTRAGEGTVRGRAALGRWSRTLRNLWSRKHALAWIVPARKHETGRHGSPTWPRSPYGASARVPDPDQGRTGVGVGAVPDVAGAGRGEDSGMIQLTSCPRAIAA